MSTALVLLGLAFASRHMVQRAHAAALRISTCRYRELASLQSEANGWTASYALVALSGAFFLPWGLLLTAWVFGYAAWLRSDSR